MSLQFPNPSRSYDPTSGNVSFWGYDDAIEVIFFIDAGALEKLRPETTKIEKSALETFDSATKQIHETATKIYGKGRKKYSHQLAAKDF